MHLASTTRALALLTFSSATAYTLFACSANVTIVGSCERDGITYDVGESFDAGDGCNTCTCDESGSIACTLVECECVGDEPDCGAPPPGCSLDHACVDGALQCVVQCEDCGDPPPISCDAPPGCFHTGLVCENGSWSCGELVCDDPCSDPAPECPQPGSPNCEAFPTCTEFGWDCQTECWDECEGPVPPCAPPPPGCETWVECDGFDWQCVTECEPEDCMQQFPEGYDFLVHQVFQECGCTASSPCDDACETGDACESADWNSTCGSCVEQIATEGGPCIDQAAFGDACASNPECAAFIDCVL